MQWYSWEWIDFLERANSREYCYCKYNWMYEFTLAHPEIPLGTWRNFLSYMNFSLKARLRGCVEYYYSMYAPISKRSLVKWFPLEKEEFFLTHFSYPEACVNYYIEGVMLLDICCLESRVAGMNLELMTCMHVSWLRVVWKREQPSVSLHYHLWTIY